ncbi:hypothetical protein Vretimale_3974 [Volvox reticuliferus]|uniref:JmjC domain-containing protein n=1 Tax=Volvox reticuliferus TaxID=1737510 RepID=A0A8J4DEY0_9CHLO|nr:hypothetical protein Vretimale_3974 [Volvox reticuliferus]
MTSISCIPYLQFCVHTQGLTDAMQSWRAAREAAVAAEVAAHRGKSPSVAAVPSPQPGQPPPPEVLRDLACLVMLLADAAMGAQFANTEGKAAAWGEERHEATGGEGGFRASSGPAAFGVAWGVGVPAGNVHVGDGGGGSGSGSSGRPGGSSSLSSTCPSRSLLQPTEWLRLLVKHWETQPLRLTQTRRCPQPRRHRGAGDFRQPTSGPANALPAGHYARYPDAMEAGVLPLKPLLDASTSSELGCRPIYDHEVGDQDDGDYSSSYMPSLTTRSVMQELLPASCHCPLMDTPDRQLLPYIRRVRTNLLPYMVAHEDVDLVRSGSERFVAAAAGTAAAAGIPIANATESAGSLVSAGDAAAAMAAPAADQPSTPPPVVAPNAVTVKDCGTAMRGGFTMVLRAAGARSAKICAVQDELESLIGLPTGANIYCTPPGNQGLAAHYDDHCVLVLQLQGAKEWLLQPPRLLPAQMLPLSYCPRLLLAPLQAIAVPDEPEILAPMGPEEGTEPALPGWAVTAKAPGMAMAAAGSPPAPSRIADREGATAKMAEPAAVTTRVVLQPGNLLYVPRGWGHQAVAVAGAAWTPVQNVWSDDRSNGNGGGRASGSDPVGTAAEGALPSGVSLHVTFGFEVEALFTWQAVAHCILALVAAERRQRRQRATWEADQVQEAHKKKHQQRRECSGGAEPGWPIRDSQYGDQAEVTATYPAQGRPLDTTLAAQVLLHAWLVRTTFSANTWPLLLLRKAAPLTVLARLGSCSQLQQPLKDITTTATVTAVADAVRCKCQPCRPSPPAGRPNAATRKGPVSAASPEVRAEAPTAVASAPREAGEAAHETAAPRVMGVGSATGGLQEPGREQQGLKTMAAVALLQNFQGCLQWREVGEKGPEPPPPLQQRKGVQAAALAEQPLVKPGLPVLISRGQVRFSGADVGTCSGSGIKEEDLPNVGASGDMLEGSNGVVMDSDTDIDRHLPCDLPASVSAGLSGGAPLEAEPLTVIALARRLMQLLHQQWQQQQQQDEDVEQHGATAQGQTKRGHGKLVDTIGGALRRATEELECHMLGVSAGRCSLAQGQGQGQEQGTGLKSSVAAAQAAARRATVDTAAGMAPHVSCGPYDAPYWLEWTTELLSKAGHCMHSCTGVLGDCALGGVDTVADGRVLCGRGGSNISFNRRDPGHGVELHQGDSAGGHEDEYRDALGSLDAVEVCNAVIRAMGCGGGSTAVDTSSGSVEDTNPWIQSVLQEAEGLLAAASSCGEEVAQCVVALVAIDQRDCLRARLRARHALLALHAED